MAAKIECAPDQIPADESDQSSRAWSIKVASSNPTHLAQCAMRFLIRHGGKAAISAGESILGKEIRAMELCGSCE